ncbi:MAG: hypothetical protein PVH91_01490 [Pseudomonadales bacterium]|jgi:hypothetical protein
MERLNRCVRPIALAVCLMLTGVASAAEDARTILEKMQQVQIERWEGVNSYYVDQTLMGNRTITYYERDVVMDDKGNVVPYFRMVPFNELQERQAQGNGFHTMSADELDAMSGAYRMTGDAMGSEIEKGLSDAGLPPGLLAASGQDPTATLDPRVMLGSGADMMSDMAAHKREAAAAPPENPLADVDTIAENAVLLGKEKIEGRQAWHIRTDAIAQQKDTTEPQEVVMRTADIWVDTKDFVPLVMKIEGEMTESGKTRPVTIERSASDFRTVPDSSMYEPYESTIKMAGTMTPEQQAEMQKAQAQMADLEKQLESMPESQRDMIMQRMGPQLDMVRQMAAGGGMEIKTVVNEIKVNPTELPNVTSLPGVGDVGAFAPGASAVPGAAPATPAPAATAPAPTGQALADAQRTCLEEKMKAAQEAQQTKRGFGRLMSAVSRTAGRFGSPEIGRIAGDVYSANATADDLAAAAKDLGLTQDDIDACRSP